MNDLDIKEYIKGIRKYRLGTYYENGELRIRHHIVNIDERSVTQKEYIILKYT